MIRSRDSLLKRYKEIEEELKQFPKGLKIILKSQRSLLFHYRELLLAQRAYTYAMLDYMEHGGKSRGSALYTDQEGRKPLEQLPELDHRECNAWWRPVREIPKTDLFFENVWREFRLRNHLIKK